jgi:hypothetical protein
LLTRSIAACGWRIHSRTSPPPSRAPSSGLLRSTRHPRREASAQARQHG